MDAARDHLLTNTNTRGLGRVVGWVQGARDAQLVNTTIFGGRGQAVVGIQGARDVQLVNASINVVGRDNYSQTHVHYHGGSVYPKAILDGIDNFRRIQQETLEMSTFGTIEWIFKSQYFSIWWNNSGKFKILWGSGIPGAGKTILTSIVINEVERRAAESPHSICIAYFYIRYSEHAKLTVRGVLEALVKQSLERHETLVSIYKSVTNPHVCEDTRPSEQQLLGLLKEFTEHMATFYFLDALDEAPVEIRHDLVEKLASLNAQLFITSRPMKEVQPLFPDALCFDIVAQEQDLNLHITKKLGSPRLRALLARRDASFREEVISVIKLKCGGMFLHASLQLDALQKCTSINSVMQTLERFPVDIEAVYHQTWERVLNQGTEQATLAAAALVWVVYAKRSLTIEELCCATATDPVTHEFEEDRLIPPSTIVDLCHGLLTMDEESRLVRLVHYTAKQPVQQLLSSLHPSPHTLLATVLTTHLTSHGFQDTTIASEEELNRTLESEPLLHYAYDFWPFHSQESLHDYHSTAKILAFIEGCHAFPARVPNHNLRRLHLDFLGPLHIVAFYNLPVALAGQHHMHGPNINAPTTIQRSTPLSLASLQGHYTAVQSFLDFPNLFINTSDRDGFTALMYAAWRGCENTIKLLLASSININLVNSRGSTALGLASSNGHHNIVKLLLNYPDIQVNLANQNGDTALMLACWFGRAETVKLLLAHPGININVENNLGSTAGMLAWKHRLDEISYLISHSTDAKPADKRHLPAALGVPSRVVNTAVELLARLGLGGKRSTM